MKLRSYQNEILYGFIHGNITDTTVSKCLEDCLMNCMCLSFQICDNTCQLCSSTKELSSASAIRHVEGCTQFEFEKHPGIQVSAT